MATAPTGNSNTLGNGSRALSTGEVLLASIAVIGHNVFHVIPNEVPILVVLAIISLRLRQGAWNWAPWASSARNRGSA
jgi:hypothetical protein